MKDVLKTTNSMEKAPISGQMAIVTRAIGRMESVPARVSSLGPMAIVTRAILWMESVPARVSSPGLRAAVMTVIATKAIL